MSYGSMRVHGVPTSYLLPGSTLASPTRSYRIERAVNFVPSADEVYSGQALVYQGVDEITGKPVAIKQILNPWDEGAKERFRREATFLLRHGRGNPHIVQGVEAFAQNDELFLAMEWLNGKNAIELIAARGGPLREREVLVIGEVLCAAISFFHQSGYLFRDMNEGNFMVLEDGRVVVIDLGGILPLSRPKRATGLLPPGAAPEIVQAMRENREAPFTIASEVYQICGVLYYLSTGHFTSEREEITAPRVQNSRISPALDQLLCKGLSDDPLHRFATPGMLGNALTAVRSSQSVDAPVLKPRTTPFGCVELIPVVHREPVAIIIDGPAPPAETPPTPAARMLTSPEDRIETSVRAFICDAREWLTRGLDLPEAILLFVATSLIAFIAMLAINSLVSHR